MIKSKKSQFSKDELKAYMAVPAKKKLEHLEHMSRFLSRVRPKRSRKLAQELKARGF